jgi:hypothetical protein
VPSDSMRQPSPLQSIAVAEVEPSSCKDSFLENCLAAATDFHVMRWQPTRHNPTVAPTETVLMC